ncbi:MAG: hypothetical protein GYA87_02700 [Christensenellaceae bacterium]|nr:hypothetical protein [Christensenellaceae bacterium]
MKFVKCEKCQLNYIPENETYCSVCKNEAGLLDDDLELDDDDVLFCSSCNLEKPIYSKGVCKSCYKKSLKSNDFEDSNYEYSEDELDDDILEEDEDVLEENEDLEGADDEDVSFEFEKENEENASFDDEEEW